MLSSHSFRYALSDWLYLIGSFSKPKQIDAYSNQNTKSQSPKTTRKYPSECMIISPKLWIPFSIWNKCLEMRTSPMQVIVRKIQTPNQFHPGELIENVVPVRKLQERSSAYNEVRSANRLEILLIKFMDVSTI